MSKSTKTLKLDVPSSYKVPQRLTENSPETNVEILNLGLAVLDKQEQLSLDKIKDDALHKILQTKTEYELEIKRLKDQTQQQHEQMNQKTTTIKEQYESETQILREELERLRKQSTLEWNVYFNDGREKGKKENDDLINHLKTSIDEEKQRFQSVKHIWEKQLEEERTRNKEMREHLTNSLLGELRTINDNFQGDFRKRLETFIDKFSNNSAKLGELGESFIEDYFNHNLSSFNTKLMIKNKQKDQGDLRYHSGDLRLLVESKNVEFMTKADITKFIDNIQTCKEEINAALLISLRDTYLIEGQKGFVFDYYQNVPIIYLGDVLNNPDLIKTAVMVLGYLVAHGFTRKPSTEDSEDNEKDYLQEIIQRIYAQFQLCRNMQDKNRKFISHLEDENRKLDTTLMNIENIFKDAQSRVYGIKYDNQYALINIGKGEHKEKEKNSKEDKLRKEIIEKFKGKGQKVSRQALLDLGYTERQIRCIKIKEINLKLQDDQFNDNTFSDEVGISDTDFDEIINGNS